MIYPHWRYFVILDSDLDIASRYVEITKDNYKTYSIEFVHILLAACSEIDVVAKIISKNLDSSKDYENINDCRVVITKEYPKLPTMKITVPRYEVELLSWSEWKREKTPAWWKSYNQVKHNRDISFKQANLENVLDSLAGLFVLTYYLYRKDFGRNQPIWPKVLSVEERFIDGARWGVQYRTPDD